MIWKTKWLLPMFQSQKTENYFPTMTMYAKLTALTPGVHIPICEKKPKLHELKKNKTFIYNVQALAPCSHGLLGCWVEHACVDAETLGVEQAHVEAEI